MILSGGGVSCCGGEFVSYNKALCVMIFRHSAIPPFHHSIEYTRGMVLRTYLAPLLGNNSRWFKWQNALSSKKKNFPSKVSRCADHTFVDITASEKVCFNDFRYMKFIYLHCGEETNLRDPRRFFLNYSPELFVKSTWHNSLVQTVKPSFFKEINFQKNLT